MTIIGTHSEQEELGNRRYSLTLHPRPIAFGKLQRITNILTATGDPTFPIGVDELVQFRVRDKLAGQSPVLHFGKGQTHIRITPLGTNNVDGVMDGQSIIFPEAWNNADFKLTIAGHRLQKDVTLRAGHPQTFSFRIDSRAGLDLNTLETTDFRILQPVLRDPNSLVGTPLSWVVSEQGGKTILTVTLPPGNHAGKVLDPTLTIQPDAAAGNDAFIDSVNADTNFGANAALGIGDQDAGQNDALRFLIKFDISSLPAGAAIESVTLLAYEYWAGDTSGLGAWEVQLRRLLVNWVEAQATWNIHSTGNNWTTAGADSDGNDRSAANSLTVTLDGAAAVDFVTFPSTATLIDDVAKFRSGVYNNYGWLVQAPTAEDRGAATSANLFYSSDHGVAAERPKLVIVYTMPPNYLTYPRGRIRVPGWIPGVQPPTA